MLITLLKALLIIAIPVALIVYACICVGARADDVQNDIIHQDTET